MVFSLYHANSQDREPSAMKFNYSFNVVPYNNQEYLDTLMTQRDFVITNQWGGDV